MNRRWSVVGALVLLATTSAVWFVWTAYARGVESIVRSTSLQAMNLTEAIASRQRLTYLEALTSLERSVQDIDRQIIDAQMIAAPMRSEQVGQTIQYLRTLQTYLRIVRTIQAREVALLLAADKINEAKQIALNRDGVTSNTVETSPRVRLAQIEFDEIERAQNAEYDSAKSVLQQISNQRQELKRWLPERSLVDPAKLLIRREK